MALPGECVCTGAPLPAHSEECIEAWVVTEESPDCICMHRHLTVCHSSAGYFLGYTDADGMPYSRESGYWADAGDAGAALFANGWMDRAMKWREGLDGSR